MAPTGVAVSVDEVITAAFGGAGVHDTWSRFRYFGPVASRRFDHHLGPPHLQSRGILYVAWHPRTCLAEVFQAKRRIDVLSRSPLLVGFQVVRNISLLDLTGLWPTRAGASTAITSGPRARARALSRHIYDAYPWIDGIFYGSQWMATPHAPRYLSERSMPYPHSHGSIEPWSTHSFGLFSKGRPANSTTTSCDPRLHLERR